MKHLRAFALVAAMVGITAAAMAGSDSHPDITNWLTSEPVTPIAREVRSLTYFLSALVLPFFVGPVIALLYAMYRFDARRNPKPATWHEHVPLEVAWTVIPTLILVFAALRSFSTLHMMDNPPKSDLVVTATGQQFFWQYDYPRYDVTVVDDGTGNSPLIIPVNNVVTMNGQATQVNHAWWVPAFAVKIDVIPGRINHCWFKVEREGFYKGQCAELCGTGHATMRIHVKVVSEEEFRKFILSKNPAAKFDGDAEAVATTAPATAPAEVASAAAKKENP